MTPRITTSDCGSENLLKSRCLKLTAKNCLAIGLHRVSPVISSPVTTNTSSSSSSTSPTSSLSVASDHHPSQSPPPPPPVSTCEGDNISELNALSLQSPTPSPTSPQSDRRSELVKSPQPSLENGHHQLEPIEHRQSFSSMGTDTTTTTTTTTSTRDCLCGQAFNTADLFTDFLRENLPLLNSYFCSQLLPPPSSSNASPSKLDLVGFIYPSTLLVGGHQDALHLLSALWSRRILRAPAGYAIRFIGKC